MSEKLWQVLHDGLSLPIIETSEGERFGLSPIMPEVMLATDEELAQQIVHAVNSVGPLVEVLDKVSDYLSILSYGADPTELIGEIGAVLRLARGAS